MFFKSLLRNKFIKIFTFFAFFSIIFYRWFSFSYFKANDWMYYSYVALQNFITMPLFNNHFNIGNQQLDFAWKKPIEFVMSLFGSIGANSNVSDFFLIFLPIIILLPLAGYLINKKIFHSEIAGIAGALIFSFNTYFLSIDTQGHQFLTIGFIFASFFIYFSCLKEPSIKNIIISTLFIFLTTIYDIRCTYIVIFVYIFYQLFKIFILKHTTKSLIMNNIILFVLSFGLLLYFILPLLLSTIVSDISVLDRSIFGSIFFNILHAITLHHPFWSGSSIEWFSIQNIPIYLWLLPIFSIIGVILNRKNKNVIFFTFIGLLGIILGKQESEPFVNLYQFLFNHFPGFTAFREASKFYYLIIISYSVCIGSLVDYLYIKIKNKEKNNIFYGITTSILLLILTINVKPIITGELDSMYTKKTINDDYIYFNNKIIKENNYFKTFWVPTDSRWGGFSSKNPKISGNYVMQYDWSTYFSQVIQTENSLLPKEQTISIYKKDFANKLFDNSSIKYVIVPLEDKINDDDFFVYYGGTEDQNIRQWYINELNKVSWLKKIDIGTKDLVVYENGNYKDHIYLTNEIDSIYKDIKADNVQYKFINPTEYKISLKNIKDTSYINFTDKFHPDWKLRAGNFNWFSVLTDKNYFVSDVHHPKNDANLNSFKIDPEYIKKNFNKSYYKENSDGSINLELTLYFKPQSYFYLGLIISGTTLIGCISYLVIDGVKNRKKKNDVIEIQTNSEDIEK